MKSARLTDMQILCAVLLWTRGHDSAEIAWALRVHESLIANEMHAIRAEARRMRDAA